MSVLAVNRLCREVLRDHAFRARHAVRAGTGHDRAST